MFLDVEVSCGGEEMGAPYSFVLETNFGNNRDTAPAIDGN